MKSIFKILAIISILSAASMYSMMQEEAYHKDPIEAVAYKIKNIPLNDYKNRGSTDQSNKFVEKEWQKSMEEIAALVSDKDLSGLKPLFNKVQNFGDEVFNTAKIMYGLRDGSMKDKIKTIDAIKKKQSEMKRFVVGQKIKSAFSFGKKGEQYKKIKQLLMDIVDILHNKIERMKKDIEIKKK